MSYESALVAAGAVVHEFREFGSYQGEWFAKITYNGEIGWVQGWYGSCSGCDAFEGELGYADRDDPAYQDRLANFGRTYCETILPAERYLTELDERSEWDGESKDAATWIREREDASA